MLKFEDIIESVDRELLISELTEDKFLKATKCGSNLLYVVDYKNSPAIMREIGRLRELSFREAGGGCGKSLDIDEDDLADDGYKQLIVWDPAAEEIIGGYRFIVCKTSNPKHLSTEHYFNFSDKFRNDYLPYMIELGRSFVQPKYQGRRGNPKGIFALDNLWEGIGAIAAQNPHIKYFFGKVTMYVEYNINAKHDLLYFLEKYFLDTENLVIPINTKDYQLDYDTLQDVYCGKDYSDDYKILVKRVRYFGENIPPLVNAYMNLSSTLKMFGTVDNGDFGDVEETGILVTIADIFPDKYDRYLKCDNGKRGNEKE